MSKKNFTRKQCIRALKKIGFHDVTMRRRNNHDKFAHPKHTSHTPPFIMVPRHKDLHCQSAILKELKAMGGDELYNQFLKYL